MARAVALLRSADGLVVAAGAGMGADSGLPTFRGRDGLWAAYPALGRAQIDFTEIANPRAFAHTPRLAWGFYGHRLNLYRATPPHAGFGMLLRWARAMPHGAFAFTSNVDGHFQRAGFDDDRVCECHGSIHHLQCAAGCAEPIWSAQETQVEVDEAACQLMSPLPTCPGCGGLARPNILMFGDWGWDASRTGAQEQRLRAWLEKVDRPVVIEIGAGVNIPTVRHFGEGFRDRLIRINMDAPEIPGGRGIGVAAGGLAALRQLDAALS
ncbi:MAG TPA: Sir2 family NAD-dependent protein deacetylase [Nevskiaceae bacterium]|nr:Sir2 family NAD-dependent protein deacetylase [Nevskiaceae bacterium]